MGFDDQIQMTACDWNDVKTDEEPVPTQFVRHARSVAAKQGPCNRQAQFRFREPTAHRAHPKNLLKLQS
jgi:hypothetical protein